LTNAKGIKRCHHTLHNKIQHKDTNEKIRHSA
jgi:hypothetical protein